MNFNNPVLEKEIRARFRNRKAPAVRWLVGGALLWLMYFVYSQSLTYMWTGGSSGARSIWQSCISIQGFLIWVICPAAAGNAITIEKEQQSWQMLVFTKLTPYEILLGKLVVRLITILTIVIAFLPLSLLAAMGGGAATNEVLLAYGSFAIWISFLSTVSLFFSWIMKRTSAAISLSYLVLFALSIGTWMIEYTIRLGNMNGDSAIYWFNPVRLIAATVDHSDREAIPALATSGTVFAAVTVLLYLFMNSRLRSYAVD